MNASLLAETSMRSSSSRSWAIFFLTEVIESGMLLLVFLYALVNQILYVHRQSNHPPALLKNIPENINKRLTSISSSQKVFDDAIPPYQGALDVSGYNHKLTYNPQPKRNRNRQRKIIWYNPPWNANVKTNLGRKFLNIIDRCFPNGHPLHKIFNKHTLKFSYSCMPNIKSIISSHNKALLSDYHQSQTQTSDKECNCRKRINAR